MPHATPAPPRNQLLRSLAPRDLAQLRPQLERVPLRPKRILHYPGLAIEHVYFVESGLVSVLAGAEGVTHGIGAWLIGHEGMVGLPVVLGRETSPHRRMVQIEGSALRLSAADLRRALDELPSLRTVLLHYVSNVLVQAGQSSVCNASHGLSQRLARWLLMVQDRLGRTDLPVTHDTIARMLGTRRASVTEGLHLLAETQAVAQERRLIRILDRARLEQLSCGCYRTMRIECDRHLLPTGMAGPAAASPPAAGALGGRGGRLFLATEPD
jgi:CRP-like cAMP-binding protein